MLQDDDVIQHILNELKPISYFVYLMGSYGTERFNKSSDIDVAAYFKNEPTWLELQSIKNKIETQLSHDLDLVSLNHIDPIYGRQVLENGRLLYCADDALLLSWKVKTQSVYFDFKFSRKIVEDNLLRKKKNV